MKPIFAAFLFFVMSFPVFSQPHGPNMENGKNMQEIEKKIDQRILLRISNELNLEDDKLLEMGKILKWYREESRRQKQAMNENIESLQKIVKDGVVAESEILKVINKNKQIRKEMQELETLKLTKIESVLPGKKLAQYILLERNFRHDLWNMMKTPGRGKHEED
jgi:hypothetical protein